MKIYTASRSAFVTFFVLYMVGFLLPCAVFMAKGDIAAWFIAGGSGVLIMGPLVLFKVRLSDTELSYRFGLIEKSVKLSEIYRFSSHGPALNRLGPVAELCIYTNRKDRPSLIVNIKPMARADVSDLKACLANILKKNENL